MTKAPEHLGPEMSSLLNRYELYARAAGFSPAQVTHMRNCVGYFDRFLGGITDPARVTADGFRRYLADLPNHRVREGFNNEQPRSLSGTTINTYARAVKAFFSWMVEEGIIPTNPIASVKIPKKPKTLPIIYSEQDLHAVITAAEANLRDNAVFSLFIDSGIRLAELAGIKMGNLDIPGGWVKVRGKGQKERVVPFHIDAARALTRYIETERQHVGKDDHLFLGNNGRPLSKRGVQSLLVRLGRKAGIKERLAPHKLRHSFATLSAKYGANLEELRIILGHADVRTTSNSYLNLQDADLKKAHARFSPLAHLKRNENEQPFTSLNKGRQPDLSEVKKLPEQKQSQETILSEADDLRKQQESQLTTTDGSQVTLSLVEAQIASQKDTLLSVLHQRLFLEHSQKLTTLVRSLVEDIKNNSTELKTKIKTKPGAMFPNLGAMYCSQKLPLWLSLSQHLNNEFNNPSLVEQINQVATAACWHRVFHKEPYESGTNKLD